MKTIALRFGEHFAPPCGTIAAHNEIISQFGHVWYGKLGSRISQKAINEIMNSDDPMILLIRSGHTERYWAHIEKISYELPPLKEVPDYYREEAATFKSFIKITSFELAAKDIMSKCIVVSSGKPLGEASKHSMSPIFLIEYKGGV